MRATRPHGGRDQYGIGRKANSSRPESNRLSHPDSNFYSIRAFTLSIKSSLDYGECRNCENRKSRPGGLDRSSVKRPASGLLRLQERPSGLAPCWLKSRYCSADKCTTLSMGLPFPQKNRFEGVYLRTQSWDTVQTNYLRDSLKSIGRDPSRQSHRGSRKYFSSDGSQPCPFRDDWLLVHGRVSA